MPARKKTDASELPLPDHFEDALGSLEEIVEAMEHEQLPLEDLVAYYEKGSALLNRCESILQSARGRIELITLRNQAETGANAPLETPLAKPSAGLPVDSDDDDDDDDIRLF